MAQALDGRGAVDRLSLNTCLGFGVGAVGISILLNTVSTYFPALMSTVLGQSAAAAGLLLTVSKLYDAFADLTVGAISDRSRSRIGRRRPFFLFGATLSAASLVMIFAAPSLGHVPLLIYMGAALLIYSTGYSLFAVPHLAMAGEMTDSYNERTRLLSFRVFFISVGQLLAGAGAAWLLVHFGKGGHGYAVMGAVMAALTAGVMLASFLGTAGAPFSPPARAPSTPWLQRFVLLAANRPLVLLLAAKFAQYVSIAVASTTKLLFMLNVLKIGYEGWFQMSLAQNIATAAAMPAWLLLARWTGKKPAFIIAILILAGAYLSWLWTSPGIAVVSIWARGVFTGIGGGGMVLMGVAMLPDAMELDRQRTGLQREGVFSGLYAVVEKAGYAVGPAIIGVYMAAAGYLPTTGGRLVSQPAAAVRALYAGATIIPAALLLLSLLLILGYNLTDKTLSAGRALALAAMDAQ